jgi:hypothetical protein
MENARKGQSPGKTAAMLALFILCGGAILFIFATFYSDLGRGPDVPPTTIVFDDGKPDECTSGDTRECISDSGCPGERRCMHGSWSTCAAYSVCTPGDERFCSTHTCTSGIQVCNDCGQWGRCTLP